MLRWRLGHALLAALVVLAGCNHTVGHDFARPGLDVVLGSSTEADILGRFGPPTSRDSIMRSGSVVLGKPTSLFDATPAPGEFTHLRYVYVSNQAPIVGGEMNQKAAVFTLWNGRLVSYDFNSSFPEDSSDFDEDVTQTFFAQHPTSQEQVSAQFGRPGGRMTYPETSSPGLEKWHYSFLKFDSATRERHVKIMDIVFDASGKVLDYRAISAANPFAPHVAPASGGGLLFLPVGRVGGGHR